MSKTLHIPPRQDGSLHGAGVVLCPARPLALAEGGAAREEVEILFSGTVYGSERDPDTGEIRRVDLSDEDMESIARGFAIAQAGGYWGEGIGMPLTRGHAELFDSAGFEAFGSVVSMETRRRPDGRLGLVGTVDYSDEGADLVRGGKFRSVSLTFVPREVAAHKDGPHAGQLIGEHLPIALTLTNRPMRSGLKPPTALADAPVVCLAEVPPAPPGDPKMDFDAMKAAVLAALEGASDEDRAKLAAELFPAPMAEEVPEDPEKAKEVEAMAERVRKTQADADAAQVALTAARTEAQALAESLKARNGEVVALTARVGALEKTEASRLLEARVEHARAEGRFPPVKEPAFREALAKGLSESVIDVMFPAGAVALAERLARPKAAGKPADGEDQATWDAAVALAEKNQIPIGAALSEVVRTRSANRSAEA